MKYVLCVADPEKILKLVNSDMVTKMLDISGFNYSVLDCQGNYVVQNELMHKHVTKGLKKAQIIDPISWENCVEVMKKGKRQIIEEQFENIYYLSVKTPLVENKKCFGIVVLSIDVTAQKKAEIMKKLFIESIYHDVQSPFFTLRIMPEVLARDEPDPKRKDTLMMISSCASRVSEYLGKIMDFATAEDKSIYNKKTDVNVKDIVNGVVAIVKPMAVKKGLQLKTSFINKNNPENDKVHIQQTGLEQILLNLVTNAVKFTDKGHVAIKAKIENNSLTLAVSDTGIGINPKHFEKIFEKFVRVIPANLEPEYKGAGMGLALVKKLADSYGWKIGLKSVLKKGSVFTVRIPV